MKDELFGYYECEKGIDYAAKVQAESEVVKRWDESMKGILKLEISDETGLLFQKDFDCEAFAPDQWLGMGVMPET